MEWDSHDLSFNSLLLTLLNFFSLFFALFFDLFLSFKLQSYSFFFASYLLYYY